MLEFMIIVIFVIVCIRYWYIFAAILGLLSFAIIFVFAAIWHGIEKLRQ